MAFTGRRHVNGARSLPHNLTQTWVVTLAPHRSFLREILFSFINVGGGDFKFLFFMFLALYILFTIIVFVLTWLHLTSFYFSLHLHEGKKENKRRILRCVLSRKTQEFRLGFSLSLIYYSERMLLLFCGFGLSAC